jgi:predicted nucleic acid-binding protein
VVLDVLLAREPFLSDSIRVLEAVEISRCRGLLCATTLTTIHYILRRAVGTKVSLQRVGDLLSIFDVAPVNRPVLETAVGKNFTDFEDAVMHQAAIQAGADCVVTRNITDFKNADLSVFTPAQFLAALDLERRSES